MRLKWDTLYVFQRNYTGLPAILVDSIRVLFLDAEDTHTWQIKFLFGFVSAFLPTGRHVYRLIQILVIQTLRSVEKNETKTKWERKFANASFKSYGKNIKVVFICASWCVTSLYRCKIDIEVGLNLIKISYQISSRAILILAIHCFV